MTITRISFCSTTEEDELAIAGYLELYRRNSPQQEAISKSSGEEMRQPYCLLSRDASFLVLRCIQTTGGHIMLLDDCPMSVLIGLWCTHTISLTQERVSIRRKWNPLGCPETKIDPRPTCQPSVDRVSIEVSIAGIDRHSIAGVVSTA